MDLALVSLFASFLDPLDQAERIKEAMVLIRGRAKLGYFVPTSHCLSAYLCCGPLGPLPHPTQQRASPRTKVRTGRVPSTLDGHKLMPSKSLEEWSEGREGGLPA